VPRLTVRFMKYFLFVVLFLLITLSFAQSKFATIEGYIIDSHNKPIPNVHIFLLPLNHADVTDNQGHFEIKNVPAGIYQLKIDHIAYETKIINNLRVRAGSTLNIEKQTLKSRVLNGEGVIITASRTARQRYDVPHAINLVSAEKIQQRNAKTSAEALREEVGVFVQKTSHAGGSAVIRGLSSNQILILVDGIRMNNSIYRLGNHQYLTTIDNQLIQQLEVVHGPTSTLYGSDALGGTINVLTKTPELEYDAPKISYAISGRYATVDAEKTTRTELVFRKRKVAFQIGLSTKSYNDLKRGKNSQYPQLENSTNGLKQSPTGFNGFDLDAKLISQISPTQSIILAGQRTSYENCPRYDKYENNGYLRWLYQPQNRNLVYLRYKNSLQSKYVTAYEATLSWQQQVEGREMQSKVTSPLTKEKDDVHTLGFMLQFHSNPGKHLLTYGAEIYADQVASERYQIEPASEGIAGISEKSLRARYPDGAEYTSLGFYFQDEYYLHSRWQIIFGARYSYFLTDFELPASENRILPQHYSQNFQALTGKFSQILRLTERIYFNLNLGQAFRAPNLSDISKFGESKGDTYEIPNPALAPEKMLSYDFGFKCNFPRFKLSASAYSTRIHDLLGSADAEYNGSGTIQINESMYKVKTKKNIGQAFIRGFEIAVNYNFFRKLNLRANFTHTYGQNSTLTEPVGGIPPAYGLIGLNWQTTSCFCDLYCRFARKQTRLSADDRDDPRIPIGGTPGWQTLNFRSGLELTQYLFLQLAIENIFDLNYREHGSGVNGPGRNFILSLRFKQAWF